MIIIVGFIATCDHPSRNKLEAWSLKPRIRWATSSYDAGKKRKIGACYSDFISTTTTNDLHLRWSGNTVLSTFNHLELRLIELRTRYVCVMNAAGTGPDLFSVRMWMWSKKEAPRLGQSSSKSLPVRYLRIENLIFTLQFGCFPPFFSHLRRRLPFRVSFVKDSAGGLCLYKLLFSILDKSPAGI